jgi:hypothetical protein
MAIGALGLVAELAVSLIRRAKRQSVALQL